MHSSSSRGFSVLEALTAATLLAGAIVVLLHVVTQSAIQAVRTESAVVATTLAQAKLEELRATPFRFDDAGGRVDDPALAASAADAHLDDSPPHLERLDRFGAPPTGDAPPDYVRRWSIAAYDANGDALRLTVCVAAARDRARAPVPTCVWTIRARQP